MMMPSRGTTLLQRFIADINTCLLCQGYLSLVKTHEIIRQVDRLDRPDGHGGEVKQASHQTIQLRLRRRSRSDLWRSCQHLEEGVVGGTISLAQLHILAHRLSWWFREINVISARPLSLRENVVNGLTLWVEFLRLSRGCSPGQTLLFSTENFRQAIFSIFKGKFSTPIFSTENFRHILKLTKENFRQIFDR